MNASKEHILLVSLSLFLQKSFKEVTMKEIVEKTGLSKGAFYHYFSSKEELFIEIIRTYFLKIMKVDYSRFSKKSFRDFYCDYINYIISAFEKLKIELGDISDEDDINYFVLAFDAMRLFPGFKEEIKEVHASELASWEQAVSSGKASGEIRSDMTDRQIAGMFVYTNDGLGLRLIMEGRVKQIEQEMLTLWDSFYNQIKV